MRGLAGRLVDPVAALVTGPATDTAVDAAYAAGWGVVKALPEPVAAAAFDLGADVAWRRDGPGVQRLRGNLARVAPGLPAPELDALVRRGLRSYARYWREVFRLPVTPPAQIVQGMHTTGEDAFRAILASGRGVVAALPHSGNWDHAGAWCGHTGLPFTTVAERLKPASLFDRFVAFRQSLGMEVLPLTGGPRPVYDVLAERVRAGGLLCLLADRDLSARGVEVSFFGAPARMPAGPATLALRTGAALLPVTLAFAPDGWRCTFWPEVPRSTIATMTQQVADAFAAAIAAQPQDWHMLQPLWPGDLAPVVPRQVRR